MHGQKNIKRIEVSRILHENHGRFYIVHEKSVLPLDGNAGHSDAPEAFLFADVSYFVAGSLCTFDLFVRSHSGS